MQHEIIIRNVYCKITQKTININGLIRTKKRESTNIVQAIPIASLISLLCLYTTLPVQNSIKNKIKEKGKWKWKWKWIWREEKAIKKEKEKNCMNFHFKFIYVCGT